MQVEAVYENGVLKPVRPLDLREHERVTIELTRNASPEIDDYMETIRRQLLGVRPPTLEEVRRIVSAIPGTLSEDFIAERGDR